MIANRASCMKPVKMSECSHFWSDIFTKANNASPFISYEWFTALCKSVLNDDPQVLVCSDGNRPISIIPAYVKNNTLSFLIDDRVTDLIDIICLPGYERQTIEILASFIIDHNLNVDISPLETESRLCKLLPSYIDDINIMQTDICPVIALGGSWDEYLNSLSAKPRHELRRKMKKASDLELRSIDRSQIDIFFKLMAASGENKEAFINEQMQEFFITIAKLFTPNQWLRMRTLYSDSTPIAALFAFQMKDHIYLYNSGFDPAYYQMSPGIIAISRDIRVAIDEKMKYYDFLRGDEKYKFHFGAKTRNMIRLTR